MYTFWSQQTIIYWLVQHCHNINPQDHILVVYWCKFVQLENSNTPVTLSGQQARYKGVSEKWQSQVKVSYHFPRTITWCLVIDLQELQHCGPSVAWALPPTSDYSSNVSENLGKDASAMIRMKLRWYGNRGDRQPLVVIW